VRRGLLLALIVTGVLCAATCAGVALCLGLLARWQTEAVLEDPPAIAAAGEAIVPLDLPPSLEPVSGMRMEIPLTDDPLVYSATYEGTDPVRFLILFAIRRDAVSDASALRGRIERLLRTATQSTTTDLAVDREWTDTILVHGEPVAFHFRHTTNAEHTVEVTDASGMFEGAFGTVTVIYVTLGALDEAELRAIFR
jgi:hypothetical protein